MKRPIGIKHINKFPMIIRYFERFIILIYLNEGKYMPGRYPFKIMSGPSLFLSFLEEIHKYNK